MSSFHASECSSYENIQETSQLPSNNGVITLAVLSNLEFSKINSESDIQINLVGHDLDYSDFLGTFFHNKCGAFNVNMHRTNWKLLVLNEQIYKNHGTAFKFNLYEIHRNAYSMKYHVPKTQIPILKNLLLRKELHDSYSLTNIHKTQVAQNIHDTLEDAINDGILVKTGDLTKGSKVSFSIQLLHYSCVLGTTVSVIFTFNTVVPGVSYAKNISECDFIHPYSACEMPADDDSSVTGSTVVTNDPSCTTKNILKMCDEISECGTEINSQIEFDCDNHVKW